MSHTAMPPTSGQTKVPSSSARVMVSSYSPALRWRSALAGCMAWPLSFGTVIAEPTVSVSCSVTVSQ